MVMASMILDDSKTGEVQPERMIRHRTMFRLDVQWGLQECATSDGTVLGGFARTSLTPKVFDFTKSSG